MANKDKLIENAQKFLAKGQLPKAIGEYQKVVDAFPKDYRNRQKLAELLTRERRYEEAQPHYEAVAKNFTDTGFYLKAIAIYKQMQKLEPARIDIYLQLAELNEKQGLIGNCLNEYRSLLTIYEKNHQPREAVGIMRKMLALEPDNCALRHQFVETLAAVDEENEALEQFCALDRMLSDRGDQAGLATLHAKFAALRSRMTESRSQTSLPPGEAAAAAATAPGLNSPADGPVRQAGTADHPELELDLELPGVSSGATGEPPSLPASEPPVSSPATGLTLEIDLELDLDLPGASAAAAVPAGPSASMPADAPDVTMPPPEMLDLPDFSGLGLEAEQPASECDAMASTVAGAPPGAFTSAENPAPFAEVEMLEAVELPDDGPDGNHLEELEEFEEIEALDEADVDPPGSGYASPVAGCHDAGVFSDQTETPAIGSETQGISQEEREEAQSHFDLGIAYKEMGLLAEAIAEFSKAAHEPSRRLDCLTLQGQCRAALGDFPAAEATFKEALGSSGLSGEVLVALRYELGLLYEATGRALEALESFQFVGDRDLFFREVRVKLKALRQTLGLDDPQADEKGKSPGRDRISYV